MQPIKTGPASTVLGVLVAACGWTAGFAQPVSPAPSPPPRFQLGPEVPVTAADMRKGPANNSPVLAADPTDRRFVVLANRLDAPDFGCALQLSGNGGRSWLRAKPVPKLPKGADKCYAPEIAFDRNGVLHYLFIGLHGAGNSPMGVYLTSSADRGRSFSPPRRVLGSERYMVRMTIDRAVGRSGRIYLVWLQAGSDPPLGGLGPPPNPIMSAFSDNGGKTFSRPVKVNDPRRELSVAPSLAIGPSGDVHVAYYDLVDDLRDYRGLDGPVWEGRWSLVLASSFDRGKTFKHSEIDPELVPPERVMLIFTMSPPAIAAGPSGRVFVAWHDARNGDWDVFARRSTDRGRSWGALQRLNDDATGNGRHQYLPRLSVAPGGRVDAVFYDRRADPNNIRNDVYLASSANHGRAFSPNLKLTSESSNTRIGQVYLVPSAVGQIEFGGRLGLLSARGSAVAAWTDTRNSFVGRKDQDVFARQVRMDG